MNSANRFSLLFEINVIPSALFLRQGRGGREAEGGGLLNRYSAQKRYRGFESPPLRWVCVAKGAGRRARVLCGRVFPVAGLLCRS